jgi:phospholipid/cholesterol/gamma-HCH transport system ATP-binding protein
MMATIQPDTIPAGERIIEVEGLTSVLGEQEVLSEINFHALSGEITIILGESGSGKTTLLKHLLGLYPSRDDCLHVLGQNPSVLTDQDENKFYQRIGVLYQEGALLNSMTVGENIGLPLEQHTQFPGELIEKIVQMKLKLVNLGDVYHLYPSQLSGGMLKRAALARAIVMDPPLLFCDEPGAGLDPVNLSKLDSLILDLKAYMGMTIMMVTHELSSILRMADRIVYLEKGRCIFQGSLESALTSDLPSLKSFFAGGGNE